MKNFVPGARRATLSVTLAAVCLSSFAAAGCRRAPSSASNPAAAAPASSPAPTPARTYTPIFAARDAAPDALKRGTLGDDFRWAAAAHTLEEAAPRWEEFLKTHAPQGAGGEGGEYEDAFQANHVSAARYELMRVYYLLGRAEDGDRLLRALDPLALSD